MTYAGSTIIIPDQQGKGDVAISLASEVCSHHNFYTLRDIDYNWWVYIAGQDCMSHAIMVVLPCFLFELSPLNNSIMLGQDSVLHAKMVALPCFLFELSPLNNSIMLGQDIVLHAKMVALPCVLFELSPLMHKQCVFHSFHSL